VIFEKDGSRSLSNHIRIMLGDDLRVAPTFGSE
jgi:hypothetical protein